MPASIFSETELATLHALRRFLFFAHEGSRQADQQTNQVLCLNLVTNAIVTWSYMNAAIERLRAEGRIGRDIDLGHLSPALYGHVNPYGKYRFEIEGRAPPACRKNCVNPVQESTSIRTSAGTVKLTDLVPNQRLGKSLSC